MPEKHNTAPRTDAVSFNSIAGLDSPNPNLYVPESFINRLRDLNPVKKNTEPAPTSDKTAGAS